MEIFSLFARIGLKQDEFNKGIDDAKGKLSNMSDAMQRDTDSIQSKMLKFSAVVGAALTAVGGFAINVGSSFESSMAQVAATMGIVNDKSDATFNSLYNLAREMGANTKFSATQAADAINNLAMAGYGVEEIMVALPQVLNLASAGTLGLDRSAGLAANGLKSMSLGVEYLGEMSDKLAVTASSAFGSVSDFGEGLLVAGGQAKLANVSLTDTFTALGILGDNGIAASEGGTALRNTLKNLYTPTSAAKDVLRGLGVETATATGEQRNLQDVLQELGHALDGLTEVDRMDAMAQIFDTRTIAAANALMKDSGARWDELSKKIDESSGAAEKMASTMENNLKGSMTIIKSLAEGLGIAFYEKMQEPLRKAAEVASGALAWLSDNLDLVIGVVGTATIAVGAFTAAWTIGNTIQKAVKSIELAKAAVVAATAATGGMTFALGSNTIAEAARTAAIARGIAVNTAGQIITKAGTVATQAETIALAASAGAITAKSVLVGVLNGQISLATAAQLLWNAAMSANPIGLVLVGVAALTAGIVALVKWTNKQTEEQKALKDSAEGLASANKSLLDTIEGNKNAYEDNAKSILATSAASEMLAGKVYELAAAESKSAEDKQLLLAMVDQLNESMPELCLQYDAEADALNKCAVEVYTLIAARKEEAKHQAARERAVEIAKEQMDIEAQLNSVSTMRIDLEKRKAAGLDNVSKSSAGVLGGTRMLSDAQFKYQKELDELTAAEAELTSQLVEREAALDAVTGAMVDAAVVQAAAAAAGTESTKTAMDIQGKLAKERTAAEEAYTLHLAEEANKRKMTIDEFTAHLSKAALEEMRTIDQTLNMAIDASIEQEAITKRKERMEENYTRHLTQEANKRQMTVEELMKFISAAALEDMSIIDASLEHAIGVRMKQEEISKERQRIDEEYTLELTKQANLQGLTLDEYKKKLADLEREEAEISKRREETLKKYTDLALDMFNKIETESKVSVGQMTENLEHNQKVIDDWGDNILSLEGKIDTGLLDKLKSAGPESAATVAALVRASDTELERLSVVFANGSQVATDALLKQLGLPEVTNSGSDMVDKMSAGVNNNASLTTSSQGLIDRAKTTMETAVATNDFPGVGGNIIQRIIEGANSKAATLYAAVQALISGSKGAADEKVSASNFPGIGEGMIQGIINGANSKASALYSTITSIANNAAQKARDALKISSPSIVFKKIGENTGEGFIRGAVLTAKRIGDTMKAVGAIATKGVWSGIDSDAETLTKKVSGFFGNIVETAKNTLATKSRFAIKSIIGALPSFDMENKFADANSNLEGRMQLGVAMATPRQGQSGAGGREGGGLTLNQYIYTQETNYAAQQREAAKNLKLLARGAFA